MYKLKRGVKIMEIKKILQKLNNQYFKSLKRFEHVYFYMSNFDEQVKKFNDNFLNLMSAVINNKTDNLDLNANLVYIYATTNEKNELRILIDSIPTNH